MRTGDVVTARIGGHRVTMLLDEPVLPDRTCGQYDEGFWAYDPAGGDDEPGWFVSSWDGSVYGPADNGTVTRYVGDVETVSTPPDE